MVVEELEVVLEDKVIEELEEDLVKAVAVEVVVEIEHIGKIIFLD